jgi:hypothetical protein
MVDVSAYPYQEAVRQKLNEIAASTSGSDADGATAGNQLVEITALQAIQTAVQDNTTPVPVFASGLENETVAASQTDQILGATGAVGDRLDYLLVVPATTSPGIVEVQDADGTAVTVFTGGASSVSNLTPFTIIWGKACTGVTTPGWKITTGANVSVVAFGNFS